MKKTHKKRKITITVLIVLVFAAFAAAVIPNQLGARYEALSASDQMILKEFDTYCQSGQTPDIWPGFGLEQKTILTMGGSFGSAYLINPSGEISNIFAKKIQMPEDFKIAVYRISPLAPQLLSFRIDGNFNTIGETYSCFGNPVYYVKYDKEEAVSSPYSSNHFITFLNHEAFHYYMQNQWMRGSTFSAEGLSEEDLALLYEEYQVLTKIQEALLEQVSDQNLWREYATEYVSSIQKRIQQNPSYVKKELERETVEGTATYVGIKASKIADYDYGVMYFDNIKDVPFSDLQRVVESGLYEKQKLADRIPYETGALLCLLMDELKIPNWQETLNSQTIAEPVTLYDIIQSYCDALPTRQ